MRERGIRPAWLRLLVSVALASCGDTLELGRLGTLQTTDSGAAPLAETGLSSEGGAGFPLFSCDAASDAACGVLFDPCKRKACGDSCTTCPATDPNCLGASAVERCDAKGVCTSANVLCSSMPPVDDGGAAD